jgi:hypothetical protein
MFLYLQKEKEKKSEEKFKRKGLLKLFKLECLRELDASYPLFHLRKQGILFTSVFQPFVIHDTLQVLKKLAAPLLG